ncbi:hypothetical protein RHGRI_015940 [Rhododendron griersonianum]|nr:hypothetical protein RHGRI_015940 [Rhododendron griersonianum]
MNVENDMDSLIKTNKLLESKVANLQVELDKANATFKKLNAGSQVLDQILLSQKVASDRSGLGYEVKVFSKSMAEGKIVKPTEKQIASPKDIAKTNIKKIGNTNVFKQPTPTDARIQRGVNGKSTTKRGEVSSSKFKPTCHNCGMIGHIRNKNVMANRASKIVGNFEQVKVRLLWVRKSDLRTHVELPSNPLDDTGSSGGINLAF